MGTPVREPTSTADRLAAAGERVTRQRLLVADALAAHGRQITAQDLYDRLRRREPRLGRATVFRTLEALVAAGVARRHEQDGHVDG
jgi:Fe2+ or Zn2+ uptake regulation protein